MVEALEEDSNVHAQNTSPPLTTLSTFKSAITKDEVALAFSPLRLHTTCVTVLQDLQVHCLQYAPQDYPADPYAKSHNKNALVAEQLRDMTDCARVDESMFRHAVEVLRDVIEEKGDEGMKGAEEVLEKMKEAQMIVEEEDE
jgi:hypothetical protein